MTKAPQAGAKHLYLGSIAKSASRRENGEERIARFALQSAARELAPANRVRSCLRAIVPGRDCVELWHSPTRQKAYYVNLITCNRVWVCPVCAAKITERRRMELARSLGIRDDLWIPDGEGGEAHITVPRYHLAMATFTISHAKGERLVDVLGRLKRAYKKMWGGRRAQNFKSSYRVIGTIRAIEPTHGDHGWHPHIHLLLVRDTWNTQEAVLDMYMTLDLQWFDACESVGAETSLQHGLTLSAADQKAAEYIGKMGQQVDDAIRRWDSLSELTKYPVKHGRGSARTLWDLLADYMGGDVAAGELWIEGIEALRGTAHLMTSPGLWKALGTSESIGDDAEMAQDEKNASDAILASLTVDQWRLVVRKNRRGELLEVANAGDPDRVAEFLRGLK